MDLGELVTNRTLLLGAGFSKNYGGFLANEINNNLLVDDSVQRNGELSKLIRDNYNYEKVLACVRNHVHNGGSDANPPSPDDLKSLEAAIGRVYLEQNLKLVNYLSNERQAFITDGPTQSFFNMFGRGNRGSVYYFSLNQDLLLESLLAHNNASNQRAYTLPGIVHRSWFFQSRKPSVEELKEKISIQDDAELVKSIEWKNRNNVVKLHGSADWQNQYGDLLVVGGDKELIIKQSPLLTAYQEVFRGILCRPGMRLMVIGYGFSDRHINAIIEEGIRHGLQLWVWGCDDRATWDAHMKQERILYGEQIRNATVGHISDPLTRVFSGNTAHQTSFGNIIDSFFSH